MNQEKIEKIEDSANATSLQDDITWTDFEQSDNEGYTEESETGSLYDWEEMYCEAAYTVPDYEEVDDDGTIRIYKNLYDDFDFSGFQIIATLCGSLVTVTKRSSSMDGMRVLVQHLEDIPAEQLMKSLNAADYFEMMNKLKEKYNEWHSFDEIVSLLNRENIPYRMMSDSDVLYCEDEDNSFSLD